eukprot:gene22110-16550_t
MRRPALIAAAALFALTTAACSYNVHLDVAPISIYANLDANVRIQLDKEVESLITKNPNLF